MSNAFEGARAETNRIICGRVIEALKDRGFKAVYAPSKEDALNEVLSLIPNGASVGVPGTVTVREIGAIDALKARGCTVFQHWGPDLTPEEKMRARYDENSADFFLTSANALTRDGRIINIDGAGNRVSAMAWGRGVLIFVIGINKITSDLEDGIRRARSATIPNALRLGLDTPCVKAGRCVDCRGANRICHALLILEGPTTGREVHVILAGENLGY